MFDGTLLAVCYYCGEVADTVDHVVPESMIHDLRVLGDEETTAALVHRDRVMQVDCCRDCNSRLGAAYSRTLDERRELLRARLRRKYWQLLAMPDWTDAEIGRMGPQLQQHVIARLELRDRIMKRLSYHGPATLYGARLK